MNFKGTVITYKNSSFGVACVNYSDFRHTKSLESIRLSCLNYFRELPFLIACEDAAGNPIYYGDQDFIRYLSVIKPTLVIWSDCTA